ncbi:MAG: hypothetical protein BGO67_09475 [Alphaproteobacteria bacterium 41-28]|nr:MAG: hypothetical protein BGO67_09475 [Alphaproteobacteria bacterium 41-28]
MKVIYFGVSIFALVVSATSYAMEEKENRQGPSFSSQLNTILEQSPLSEEGCINYVTKNVVYDRTGSPLSPQNVLEYSNKALQRPNLTQEQFVPIYLNKAGAYDRLGKYSKVQKYYRKALEAKGEKSRLLEVDYQEQNCPNFTRTCGVIKMEKDTFPGLSSHRTNLGILISEMKEKSIEVDFESSDSIYPEPFIRIDEVRKPLRRAKKVDKSPRYDEARELIRSAKTANQLMRYNEALSDYIKAIRLATGVKEKVTAKLAMKITRDIGEAFKEIGIILAKQRKPKVSILALKIAYNTKGIDGDKYALNDSDRKKLPLMIEEIKNTHKEWPSPPISDPIKFSPLTSIHKDKENVEAKMAQIESGLLAGGNSERVARICDELLNLSSNNDPRSLNNSERAKVLSQKAEALRRLSNSARGSALKQEKSKEALACDEEARKLEENFVEEVNEEEAKEVEDEAVKLSPNQGSKKRRLERKTKRKTDEEREVETETETETETEEVEQSESKKSCIHKSKKSENKDPNESCQKPPLKKSRLIIKETGGRIWRFG